MCLFCCVRSPKYMTNVWSKERYIVEVWIFFLCGEVGKLFRLTSFYIGENIGDFFCHWTSRSYKSLSTELKTVCGIMKTGVTDVWFHFVSWNWRQTLQFLFPHWINRNIQILMKMMDSTLPFLCNSYFL